MSKYGIISHPYFPAFGQNTETYEVSLRIQSKCGKIRSRNNSVFGQYSRSAPLPNSREGVGGEGRGRINRWVNTLFKFVVWGGGGFVIVWMGGDT